MLHEITKRIYNLSLKLFGIQVLTENGYEDISSINITDQQKTIIIKTKTKQLKCSADHILIQSDDTEVYAKDSLGKDIKTDNGLFETILSIEESDEEELYDISLADGTSHCFYANGLLSHNCVIADEFSFVPNNIASKVFESIYPVISSSKTSQFIIVSTPNGADPNNLYYDIWCKANQKISNKNAEGWKPFRFDWWDVPGRDEQWKLNTIAAIGETRFAQEFGNEFLTGNQSRKLIPDDVLEKYRMELTKMKNDGIKPIEQHIMSEDESKVYKFKMWQEFNASRTYLATGDIAEGVGQDSSVLYIFDLTDLRHITLCAKFSSADVSLVEFAYICSKILTLYGKPPLFAERNGVSAGMLDSLRITYKYPNIARESKNGEAGIYSHVTVKGRACLWAREMMTTAGFNFVLPDQDLLDELGTFVKKDTSGKHTVFQAASGSHDDHVMALVWLCWGLSKEIIDKYFIVVKTFTSQLDEILPQILMPLNPYSSQQIKEIQQDPVYRRFVEIKNECLAAYDKAVKEEQTIDNNNDIYNWNNNQPQYFQDEWSGPSWQTNRQFNPQVSVNPNNVMPAFFV